MPRNNKCCSWGGYAFGCLVVVGAYAVLISISFAFVTALYMTSSTGCEKIEAENAKVVTVTHVDLLNQDNLVNGVKEPVAEKEETEGHAHRVYCNCGTQAIMSFFEITVLVAAITGLIFMAAMFVGLIRGTFLKSREKRLKSEKEKNDKIQKDQVDAVLLRVASGELVVPNRPRTGSEIELPS